ncbi:hypothetical protein [Nitratiruptor sp. SB155-2]|uniref:phage scaffolding protein n=1 Tax=Nitratiruptor sp. (strain SB155-2) TaxID=387092 RepID=UPI0001586F56|nr:hypothetical protein [Nitratiruptor sp. SB155-2]BAF69585.1 hypothetical protein NIS_0471 [Nitratiruptor sp. SB155-2]BAN05347.1 hypothetical protein [Nitratiruptor phage NrS-1]
MFQKLQEMLEAGKISEEVAKALDDEIGKALKDVRDEAASWRVKYKELQQNYEEVAKSKEKLEAELSSLDEKIQKAKEEGKNELVKELEAERNEKEELTKRLSELEASARNLRIENELSRALSKFEYEPIDSEIVADFLKSRHIDVVDGEIRFKKGDELMPLEEGLKAIVEERPNLFKAKGNPGSGIESTQSGNWSKKKSEMSDDEIEEFVQKHGQEAFLQLPD